MNNDVNDILDDFAKNVYNTYLKFIAERQNRPYKRRKSFEKFKMVKELLRVSDIFKKYPHIDIDMYFRAPYELWDTNQFYTFEWYAKRKALNCYVTYKKKLINTHPDEKYQLKKMVEGFKFIQEYCRSKNIPFSEYINQKEGVYSFLNHLKYDKVSIYTLLAIDGFKDKFKNEVDSELKRTLYGDMYLDYDIFYRKFVYSKKSKDIAQKCLKNLK